jgi:adenylylsulfate kinase
MRAEGRNIVLLDGDAVREVFGNDLGYDLEARRIASERIKGLSLLLDKQGFDAVCPVISLFSDTRDWCRENFSSFFEVFIDSDLALIEARDTKSIYSKFRSGEIVNVVGMDIPFPRPQNSDLVIANFGSLENLLTHSEEIIEEMTKTP